MSTIVSSLPGRIRVRDKGLRDREKLDRLKSALSEIAAITELQDNVRTGSVLLRFDRHAVALPEMEASINAAIDRVIGKPPTPERLFSPKNLNRYNKIAMLATLGASLFALTTSPRKRRIRWHKITGYLFVANLAAHLFTYRKSLSRLFR